MVHWKAAFYILGCAVKTSSYGITFQRGMAVEGFHLVSFADADYASEATDRRSVSGGGSDMSGGARSMVLADSEMRNAVNHAGRVCRDVRYCEGDLFLRRIWFFMLPKNRMPCIVMY